MEYHEGINYMQENLCMLLYVLIFENLRLLINTFS